MIASFTRTQREGETWTWLTPSRLMISHPDKAAFVIDTDTQPSLETSVIAAVPKWSWDDVVYGPDTLTLAPKR